MDEITRYLASKKGLEWVLTVKIGTDIKPASIGEDIEFVVHKDEVFNGHVPIGVSDSLLINGYDYVVKRIEGLGVILTPKSTDAFINETVKAGSVLAINLNKR